MTRYVLGMRNELNAFHSTIIATQQKVQSYTNIYYIFNQFLCSYLEPYVNHSVYAPSQLETALQCNAIFHLFGAYIERSVTLTCDFKYMVSFIGAWPNSRHFAGNIFEFIFLNKNYCILIWPLFPNVEFTISQHLFNQAMIVHLFYSSSLTKYKAYEMIK